MNRYHGSAKEPSRQATCQITKNLMQTENGYVRRGSTV